MLFYNGKGLEMEVKERQEAEKVQELLEAINENASLVNNSVSSRRRAEIGGIKVTKNNVGGGIVAVFEGVSIRLYWNSEKEKWERK